MTERMKATPARRLRRMSHAPAMPTGIPIATLAAIPSTKRPIPSIVERSLVIARTAIATSARPVPSLSRLSPSMRVRSCCGMRSRVRVATTATGSVADVIAPMTKAMPRGRPAPTTSAEMTTPGIANPTSAGNSPRTSRHSRSKAASKMSPGTSTRSTRSAEISGRTPGKSWPTAIPSRTSATDSGT